MAGPGHQLTASLYRVRQGRPLPPSAARCRPRGAEPGGTACPGTATGGPGSGLVPLARPARKPRLPPGGGGDQRRQQPGHPGHETQRQDATVTSARRPRDGQRPQSKGQQEREYSTRTRVGRPRGQQADEPVATCGRPVRDSRERREVSAGRPTGSGARAVLHVSIRPGEDQVLAFLVGPPDKIGRLAVRTADLHDLAQAIRLGKMPATDDETVPHCCLHNDLQLPDLGDFPIPGASSYPIPR